MVAGSSALTYGVNTSQQASVGSSTTGMSSAGEGQSRQCHLIELVNPWSMANRTEKVLPGIMCLF